MISLVLNVRRLYVVVDSRYIMISAAKVCDCVISAWCYRYVISWLNCDSGKLDLGLVSAGSNGVEPYKAGFRR